jgi:hypothetical protein
MRSLLQRWAHHRQCRQGGDENLISFVDKLYNNAFANNSISTMTSREFHCAMVGLLGLEKLDKKRKKAVKDQLMDLIKVSRRKTTIPPFDFGHSQSLHQLFDWQC